MIGACPVGNDIAEVIVTVLNASLFGVGVDGTQIADNGTGCFRRFGGGCKAVIFDREIQRVEDGVVHFIAVVVHGDDRRRYGDVAIGGEFALLKQSKRKEGLSVDGVEGDFTIDEIELLSFVQAGRTGGTLIRL